MMDIEWPGVLDPALLAGSYVAQVNSLADAARTGRWTDVLERLDSDVWLNANHWRIGGRSWFAPLHHVARLGAPTDVAEELIEHGAWRSLRTADGERPVDIARSQGHDHLLDLLRVAEAHEHNQQRFAGWDQHLADLIFERTRNLPPVRFRPVTTEVIALDHLEKLWFGYPGMYGGFSMSVRQDGLFVESWSRAVGGSGQAHLITESGCVLVEEGFI